LGEEEINQQTIENYITTKNKNPLHQLLGFLLKPLLLFMNGLA
jgi:hypothetical protein